MIVVVGLLAFGGKDDGLSRRKSRIGACIPAPNEDVTMPIGAKMLTEAVFRDTGLDDLLYSLKRDQGGLRLKGDGRPGRELPGDDGHLG